MLKSVDLINLLSIVKCLEVTKEMRAMPLTAGLGSSYDKITTRNMKKATLRSLL